MKQPTQFLDLVTFNLDGGGDPSPAKDGDAAGATPGAVGLLKHAGGAGAAAAPAGASDPAAAKPSDPPSAQPYFPDNLPDVMRGTNDRETIDKLAGEVMSRPKAPAKPDDYKLQLPENLSKVYGDMADDPILPLWRKIAHKHGLPEAQFNGLFADLHTEMQSAGLIEDIDDEAEMAKLMPKTGDEVSKKAMAASRLNGAINFVKGLQNRQALNANEAMTLSAVAATADGVMALEKIMKLIPGEHGLQPGGNGAGAVTKADVLAMEKDPRYSSSSATFDPAFRAKADEARRRLHGVQ